MVKSIKYPMAVCAVVLIPFKNDKTLTIFKGAPCKQNFTLQNLIEMKIKWFEYIFKIIKNIIYLITFIH